MSHTHRYGIITVAAVVVLIVSLCVGMASAEELAIPFDDVAGSDSYYTSVAWAYYNGVVKGTSATTFSPAENCTRGQFVLMLYRLAGKPDVSGTANPFRDVKKTDPYYKAVLWAYSEGIIKGTGATTFSPNSPIRRGQLMLMLYRLAGKPEANTSNNPFTDVEKSDSCYKAVLWAYQTGLTKGTSATTFSPSANCTRGQLVLFLYRFYNKGHINNPLIRSLDEIARDLSSSNTASPGTSPSNTPASTATPAPAATPLATAAPVSTATPKPTATATPTPTAAATPKPTATITPKPTATPTPTAAATPKPTATPTPTPTPTSTARTDGDMHGVLRNNVRVEPTCEEDGSITSYCYFCGEYIGTTILPATGHSFTTTTIEHEEETDAEEILVRMEEVKKTVTVVDEEEWIEQRYVYQCMDCGEIVYDEEGAYDHVIQRDTRIHANGFAFAFLGMDDILHEEITHEEVVTELVPVYETVVKSVTPAYTEIQAVCSVCGATSCADGQHTWETKTVHCSDEVSVSKTPVGSVTLPVATATVVDQEGYYEKHSVCECARCHMLWDSVEDPENYHDNASRHSLRVCGCSYFVYQKTFWHEPVTHEEVTYADCVIYSYTTKLLSAAHDETIRVCSTCGAVERIG